MDRSGREAQHEPPPALSRPRAFDEPWPEERILSDTRGLLVVDKPVGLPVHGGDEGLKDDVVQRLRALFRRRGEADYLGVHQRLDKDTSGVLLFTRDAQRNPEIARAFEAHTVEKKYLAVVSLHPAAKQRQLQRLAGTWEDRLSKPVKGRVEVLRAGGLAAVTRCKVLEERGNCALLELSPITGRTHQLRVQASARGVPIVGDRMYGGEPASRLLLHARELRVEGESPFVAVVPQAFTDWMDQKPFDFERQELRRRLVDACAQRMPLGAVADAYRLVNDLGDQLPGVCIDRFGDVAVVQLFDERAARAAPLIGELLLELGFLGVRIEQRSKETPATSGLGEVPPTVIVQEHGSRFQIKFGVEASVGLFVDQRENRQRVRGWAKGQSVLNLFCYTGSFSVAAALGGANKVVSVDLSGRTLEWARQNFELNGLPSDAHEFIQADATVWLEQAKRQKLRFDLIILDPPSFSTVGKRRTFSVARDYLETAAMCCSLLTPGGQLLAVTNHKKTSLTKLRASLRGAAATAGRTVTQLKDMRSGPDCPELPTEPYPSKSVLVRLK